MYLIHSRVSTRYFHIPTLLRFDCCCCLLLLLADCCWHCPNIATTFRQEQQEHLLGPVSESKWKFEIISKAFTTKHFVVLLVLLLENRSTETKAFMGDYTNSPGDLRAIIRIDISEWKCCNFKEGIKWSNVILIFITFSLTFLQSFRYFIYFLFPWHALSVWF